MHCARAKGKFLFIYKKEIVNYYCNFKTFYINVNYKKPLILKKSMGEFEWIVLATFIKILFAAALLIFINYLDPSSQNRWEQFQKNWDKYFFLLVKELRKIKQFIFKQQWKFIQISCFYLQNLDLCANCLKYI